MMVIEFPLEPITERCKSYWGRARVVRSRGLTYLKSYSTLVACVTSDGVLHKLWDGWSATTGRHLVEFARQYTSGVGRRLPYKAVWDKMKLEVASEVRADFALSTKNELLSPAAEV